MRCPLKFKKRNNKSKNILMYVKRKRTRKVLIMSLGELRTQMTALFSGVLSVRKRLAMFSVHMLTLHSLL
jgi:hypothetical protein